jgi:single-strand DNA-binding protein
MTDTLTLIGLVATIPRHLVTSEGLAITSFRLASTQRRFDRTKNQWVDGETNWYTVTTFRQLAINAAASVNKGDRVVVAGRLRIREWQAGDKSGTNIEVDADAVGHDLSWGSTVFSRSVSSTAPAIAPATPSVEAGNDASPRAEADAPADAWAAAPTDEVAVPF